MISPIENNGMIARTQDYTSFKQQEDIRLTGEHVNIQQKIDEKSDDSVRTVHNSDDSNRPDTHHDAKEEGRNKYFKNSGERKKSEPIGDGKVFAKGHAGFDLKI